MRKQFSLIVALMSSASPSVNVEKSVMTNIKVIKMIKGDLFETLIISKIQNRRLRCLPKQQTLWYSEMIAGDSTYLSKRSIVLNGATSHNQRSAPTSFFYSYFPNVANDGFSNQQCVDNRFYYNRND